MSGTVCTTTFARTATELMYPSDYGYATSGGSTMNRTACLNTQLANWNSNADCYQNDYIYQLLSSHTLMPL